MTLGVPSVKNGFMEVALQEASDAAARGEVPVGCVVVERRSGDIVGRSGNRVEEWKDPTAHAEMIALRGAAKKLGEARLTECDLYVSLEPCPMCAAAISFARIRRLYFGAYDRKGGGVENGPRISINRPVTTARTFTAASGNPTPPHCYNLSLPRDGRRTVACIYFVSLGNPYSSQRELTLSMSSL